MTRTQLIFCCAHKIVCQRIIQDGAILIELNVFFAVVVVCARCACMMFFCRSRCCCPFFLCRLITSLIMHSVRLQIILQRFFVHSLSNDLKSIKCCRTLKWYFFFIFYVVDTHTSTRTHKHIPFYYFKLNAMNLSNSVELSLGTPFILYYSTDLTFQISPTARPNHCLFSQHKI